MPWVGAVYDRMDGFPTALPSITSEDIKNMSMADYARYRQLSGLPTDSGGIFKPMKPKESQWPWPDSVKQAWAQSANQKVRELSSHSYTVTPVEEVQAEVQRLKDDFTEQVRKSFKAKEKRAYEDKTYSDFYWAYVNAADSVVAAKNFNMMLNKVTLEMEPAQGWKSWVEEPKPVVPVKFKRHHPSDIEWFSTALCVTMTVVFIVEMIIGTFVH